MSELTGVTNSAEIGERMPSGAAVTLPEDKDDPEQSLYSSSGDDVVFFPRDGHVVARFLHQRFPRLTRITAQWSLRYSGVADTGTGDQQEKGKVPHEVRGPHTFIARRQTEVRGWGWPYFGAVDTTGKNVLGIAAVVLDTEEGAAFLNETYVGRDGGTRTVAEGFAAHVQWMRNRMDRNPDGLMEMLHVNSLHHANESWKDSPDSFFHADGSWARHYPSKGWGVAPLEVQAETFDALLAAAAVYEKLLPGAENDRKMHLQAEITDLLKRADQLRAVVLKEFWVDDSQHAGGYFARGTDRDAFGRLHPLAVRSADMGLLLNSHILDGDEAEIVQKREAVIRNLFSPEMLCVAGIRTLSSDSPRYGEDRWHNGASWPWVTYAIAQGLQRHGYHGLAYELKRRTWSAYMATGLLPEYLSGTANPDHLLVDKCVVIFDHTIPSEPTRPIGQPAQGIQAWTAAALLAMKYEEGDRLRVLGNVTRPRVYSPLVAQMPTARQLETELIGESVPPPHTKKGQPRAGYSR